MIYRVQNGKLLTNNEPIKMTINIVLFDKTVDVSYDTHPITLYPISNDVYMLTVDNPYWFQKPKTTSSQDFRLELPGYELNNVNASGVVANIGTPLEIGQTSASADKINLYLHVANPGDNNVIFFNGIARKLK